MNKSSFQRYVFKLNSKRILEAVNENGRYEIKDLDLETARKNDELISLSESQLMRKIDFLNNVNNASEQITQIKSDTKKLKRKKNIVVSRPLIREKYAQLDTLIFKKDYINVVIESAKDYQILCRDGFIVNGIEFCRFLGTTGGVKKNTIVFVNKALYPQLKEFLDNGRDLSKEFIPAKLEAYNALVCSASVPVSLPKGVIVISDCITHFLDTYIELDDNEKGYPVENLRVDELQELNDSDGYGMGMPQLLLRWANELGEDYTLPGCVIRNSFCKGTIYPVDFQSFCVEHGVTEIRDVWGELHNILDIELVLTESMLKLWDSYSSIHSYLNNCEKNGYTFAITKNSEEKLENERTTNYQFIQSYDFSDEDIDALVEPTICDIKDIIHQDYKKTILYHKGTSLKFEYDYQLDGNFSTALMIEPCVLDDIFVQKQIYSMIKKRIDRAKIGVLNIPANYSLVSGDPYSLCQHMCGLKVTGLLQKHQVYSKYWTDKGITKIVSFRAPMTSHNNIRILDVVSTPEMEKFYFYMTTPTIFNSWDMCADAMNGFDKDGDAVINSSSPILIDKTIELPAIKCIQKKAAKKVPQETDMIEANIKSFGNAVGSVTNKITGMFEVQAGFEQGTSEYIELEKRIRAGQLYQQNAIDKTKGIESHPMPKEWYIASECNINDDDTPDVCAEKQFNKRIVANKKPYFMIYIYPELKKQYDTYVKNSDIKCQIRFGITLSDLERKSKKTQDEKVFWENYLQRVPVGTNPCVINRVCWKVEKEFDNKLSIKNKKEFDYSVYKSGCNYSSELYEEIYNLYKEYMNELKEYQITAKAQRITNDEKMMGKYQLRYFFSKKCYIICPNSEMLCDVILDICYSEKNTNNSKQFAWDMCGDQIIQNMLKKHDYEISYPVPDINGNIVFCGDKYSMVNITLKRQKEEDEELC